MSKMAELEYEQRMAADQIEDTALTQAEWETIRRATKKSAAAKAWAESWEALAEELEGHNHD
jgi:hypothetical protein